MKAFKGQKITKRYVNLGIGGQIEAPADLEDVKPRSRIRIEVEVDYTKIAHKFVPGGGVEEQHVLTIDASTFEVLEVMAPVEPQQPELPGTEDEDE
jgi:hypothetical protein